MNDFTKEELEIIALDMYLYANQAKTRNLKESPIHKELRDKIQSMIDNYCAHERKHTSRDSVYCEHCYKEF